MSLPPDIDDDIDPVEDTLLAEFEEDVDDEDLFESRFENSDIEFRDADEYKD